MYRLLQRGLALLSLLAIGLPLPVAAAPVSGVSLLVSSPGVVAGSRRRGATATVAYDTSMGASVDTLGFASLPLRSGGTDGSDLVSGTPTSVSFQGSTSYDGPSRTITTSGFIGSDTRIARWNGILSIGQQYHVRLAYNITTGAGLQINDENGTNQVTLYDNLGGSATKGFADKVFTATGTDFVLMYRNDGFTGTVTMSLVATNSGGVGAHRFFVKPSTGSDAVNCLQAQVSTTPLASITEAMKCLQTGAGDQILVAEGSTVSTLPSFISRSGYNATYPTVLQSYDPADASNESKYGRAYQRSAWVTVTNPGGSGTGGIGTLNYLAIRGFEFNPGNVPDHALNFTGLTSAAPLDYLLIEGDRFIYCGLSVNMSASNAQAQRIIIRNTVSYGSYTNTEGTRPSNVFLDNVKYTYEDNVNVHAGWKPGASRDDYIAAGGLISTDIDGSGTDGTVGYFMHPVYQTAESDAYYVRRNLIADGAGDGGSWRGDVVFTENLLVDNPVAMYFTGGDNYNTKRPSGRMITAYGNAAIGAVNVTSSYPMAAGIVTENGQSGSEVYSNLLARGTPSSSNANAFYNNAQFNQPSYINLHGNIAYLWTNAGSSYNNSGGYFPGQVFTTYGTNYTDDVTGGSNVNSGTLTFPNAYATSNALAVAAGYASKQAFLDYAVANPVSHVQRTVLTLLRTGYGM